MKKPHYKIVFQQVVILLRAYDWYSISSTCYSLGSKVRKSVSRASLCTLWKKPFLTVKYVLYIMTPGLTALIWEKQNGRTFT